MLACLGVYVGTNYECGSGLLPYHILMLIKRTIELGAAFKKLSFDQAKLLGLPSFLTFLIPRKNKRRGKARPKTSRSFNENAITTIRARSVHNVAYSTTAATAILNEQNLTISTLGSRVVAIADTFMYWRLVSFRIFGFTKAGTVNTVTTTNTTCDAYIHGIAFTPLTSANYTAPTTLAQFVDFPEMKLDCALRPLKLSVSRNGLIGSQPTKWLGTQANFSADIQSAGTVTAYLETPPVLSTVNGPAQFDYVNEYVIEFKGPIDGSINPSLSNPKGIRPMTDEEKFPECKKLADFEIV